MITIRFQRVFEPHIERKSWILENGGTRASYGFRIRRAASSISPVIQDINGVDASLERDFKGLPRPSSPPAFRGGARKKERRADSASMRGSSPWRSSEIITSYEALVVRGVQRNRRGQRVGTKSPPLSLSGSVGRDRGKPDCDLVISDFMTPRQLLYNVLKTLPCESPVKLIKPSRARALGKGIVNFFPFFVRTLVIDMEKKLRGE